MARSDKDNGAKEHALRFCVASHMLTFLEVGVFTDIELSNAPKIITDIDVLGISMRYDGSVARTVFDCKSAGGPAFARALWLSGLMKYVGAQDGLILMGKPVERAHRLAARKLDINMFGSGAFDNYAGATNPEYKLLRSYAADIENWHRIADGTLKQPALGAIYSSVLQEVPLSKDPARSLRRLVSMILPHKGELNPAKPLHMAAFTELVVSFSFLFSMIVNDLRNVIDLDEDERQFSTILRYYIWGGAEGVANLRKMYQLLAAHETEVEQETALLAFPSLVQLTRSLLDSPTSVRNSTIALRELSLRQLADINEASDIRVGRLFLAPRSRQFAKRLGSYVATVLKLPQEFSHRMDEQIDLLVAEAE